MNTHQLMEVKAVTQSTVELSLGRVIVRDPKAKGTAAQYVAQGTHNPGWEFCHMILCAWGYILSIPGGFAATPGGRLTRCAPLETG